MHIGAKLRALRKEKKMTLEELSQKSGVALATLSRMETGKMTGTLNSHKRICKALDVSFAAVCKETEDTDKVVEPMTKTARADHFIHDKRAAHELLVSKTSGKKMMPFILKIGAGGETREEETRPGVEKFLYLVAGAMEVSIGRNAYTLRYGDSLYFDGSLPHAFKNHGKTRAEAICVVAPPLF